MYLLEAAKQKDVRECYDIIQEAKQFQKAQGFTQWTDDYPSLETIREDIQAGNGYTITCDHRIAGYMCISFSGEPAYEHIKGRWNTDSSYAVIHRLALRQSFRNQGLSRITFSLIENLCRVKEIHSIRVDTDFSNKRMQHILEKSGFSLCGVIQFQGSGKLAYDKTF